MQAKWNLKSFRFFYRNFSKVPVIGILSGLYLFSFNGPAFADKENLLTKINLLDNEFKAISGEFYQHHSNFNSESKPDIDDLFSQINTLTNNKQPDDAIQLIYSNIDTVRNNLDHPSVLIILEILLNHSETNLANSLYQQIKNEGDDFQLSTTRFLFAKYHAQNLEWSKVNTLLEDVNENLSEEHSAYALLLKGTALQHLKQHRQAIKVYLKIPADSEYYRHSQLNIAIAQIRQGWLTSATNTINKLIENDNKQIDDEFTNRLYLVLGYAFLQKDYYRNSRDVFRKISQTSIYANRALLGIALCAVNLEDFDSALNTLSLLKVNKNVDLSVDESYLLTSYVYEKLQHDENVVTSSTQAMNYYQKRITNLQALTKKTIDFNQLKFDKNSPVFSIQNNNIEYGNKYPVSFLTNYKQLIRFAELNKNTDLDKAIESSIAEYDVVFQTIISELIEIKLDYLKSYLNQARYGLARLYDDSRQEEQ